MGQHIQPFEAGFLEAIAKVLGDTNSGLSGSEIANLLANSKIPDVDPQNTKWRRLLNAFIEFQNQHQVGNHVIVFIHSSMDIARYVNDRTTFIQRKNDLNQVLSLSGYELHDDGKVHPAKKANTISEAQSRAAHLKNLLTQRGVHGDILRYCETEIIADNYFHAVVEAIKSITVKVKAKSGIDLDGAKLVGRTFDGDSPVLVINSFDTETLKGEQRDFSSLLKGLYGTVRNPLAHEAKIEWNMSEQDALDVLCLISLVHRKLDNAMKR